MFYIKDLNVWLILNLVWKKSTEAYTYMHKFCVIRVLALIDNHIRQQQQNEQYLLYIIYI